MLHVFSIDLRSGPANLNSGIGGNSGLKPGRWWLGDSGIRYVSPAQRHVGEDRTILAARHELYTSARALNPARWSGATRNWSPIGPVTLNPERDSIIKTHSSAHDIQPMAA